MNSNPKEPSKDEEPQPWPIDPPTQMPPVELPGDAVDEPNM